ncbi:MAG: hypothetical protein ABSF53_19640, partial [Terracidiphilus sp.]
EGNADLAQGLGHRLRLTVVRRLYLRYLTPSSPTSCSTVLKAKVFTSMNSASLISDLPVKECRLNKPEHAEYGDGHVDRWQEIGIDGFHEAKDSHPVGNEESKKR